MTGGHRTPTTAAVSVTARRRSPARALRAPTPPLCCPAAARSTRSTSAADWFRTPAGCALRNSRKSAERRLHRRQVLGARPMAAGSSAHHRPHHARRERRVERRAVHRVNRRNVRGHTAGRAKEGDLRRTRDRRRAIADRVDRDRRIPVAGNVHARSCRTQCRLTDTA